MLKQTFIALSMAVVIPLHADDIECTGTIGATEIDGNIIVPSNRSCTLEGTHVKGNVELEDRAQLVVEGDAFVEGSVQTDGADRVQILDSEINGNIQLTGINFNQESLVLRSRIGGTVDWNDNSAPFLIRWSEVNSDIKINQNNAQARIFDNLVGGNLQCQANEPPPVGGGNVVDGNKEDQCAALSEVPVPGEPCTDCPFVINAGLNDAWFNAANDGQGMTITVFPQIKQMFVAWFTFDTERPPADVTAMLGEPGHRWLTAQGPYDGSTATLTIYVAKGGVFSSAVPAASIDQDGDGTLTLEFAGCAEGMARYEITSLGISGEIPLERIVPDNIPLCETLISP